MPVNSISARHCKGNVVLTIDIEVLGSEEKREFIITESQAENLVQPLAFSAHDAREYLEAKKVIGEN